MDAIGEVTFAITIETGGGHAETKFTDHRLLISGRKLGHSVSEIADRFFLPRLLIFAYTLLN
jgi:hypothetical protein